MKNTCMILLLLTLSACDKTIKIGDDAPDVIVAPPPPPIKTSCTKEVSWQVNNDTELGTTKPHGWIDYFIIEYRGDVGEPKTLRLNQSSFKQGERIKTSFEMPLNTTLCLRAKSVTFEPRESDWSELSCVKCDENAVLSEVDMNQGEL